MKTTVQTFQCGKTVVRSVQVDGVRLWVLPDACRAAGIRQASHVEKRVPGETKKKVQIPGYHRDVWAASADGLREALSLARKPAAGEFLHWLDAVDAAETPVEPEQPTETRGKQNPGQALSTDVQVFTDPEFGQLRTIEIDGEVWFVGKDVAAMLGYSNPRDAIAKHVDDEDKRGSRIATPSGEQTMTIINESGMNSLILSSKLPTAKRIRRWITQNVTLLARNVAASENRSGDESGAGLEVKQVSFMGSDLIAVRDNDGQIWAGVSYICNGIGLGKNEKDRQVKNVQADRVLEQGCVKFDAGVFDPNNATIALKLDYVPLWLAKINITPKMERENPELVERLIQYQLKAKDVLAVAFLPPMEQPGDASFKARTYRIAQALVDACELLDESNAKVAALEAKVTELVPDANLGRAVASADESILVREFAKIVSKNGIEIGQNRLFKLLVKSGFLFKSKQTKRYEPTQRSIKMGLIEVEEKPYLDKHGRLCLNRTPKITAQGQWFFANWVRKALREEQSSGDQLRIEDL